MAEQQVVFWLTKAQKNVKAALLAAQQGSLSLSMSCVFDLASCTKPLIQ